MTFRCLPGKTHDWSPAFWSKSNKCFVHVCRICRGAKKPDAPREAAGEPENLGS